MKKSVNVAAQSVEFKFDDGLAPVVLTLAEMSPENQTRMALHGIAARVGDHAAIQRSAENGFKVTEAMRRDAILEMQAHYHSSGKDWELKGKARAVPLNGTILAIAQKMNISYEEAQAKVAQTFLAEMSGEN